MSTEEDEIQKRAARQARFATNPVPGPSIVETSVPGAVSSVPIPAVDASISVREGKRKAVDDIDQTQHKRSGIRSQLERELVRAETQGEVYRQEERDLRKKAENFRKKAEECEETQRQLQLQLELLED